VVEKRNAAEWEQLFNDNFPYKEIREQQSSILHALGQIYAQPKYRYTVIEAGTGVGKSGIAKAIAAVEGKAFLLTATKQLQDQYLSTFDDGSLMVLKGKGNYRCDVDQTLTCAYGACNAAKNESEGQRIRAQCYSTGRCPYRNAIERAKRAQVVVMSYAMFLSLIRVSAMTDSPDALMAKRPVLIVDECHLLEDQLVSFAGFELSQAMLDKRYGLVDMAYHPVIDSPFVDQLAMDEGALTTAAEYLTSIDVPYMEEGFAGDAVYPKRTPKQGAQRVISWLRTVSTLLSRRIQLIQLQLNAINDEGFRRSLSADKLTELNGMDKRRLSYDFVDATMLNQKLLAYLAMVDNTVDDEDDNDNWLLTVRDPKAYGKPKPRQYTATELEQERSKVRDGYRVAVQPLDVNRLFTMFMDRFAVNHVVFMSATIIDKPQFCSDLGLDRTRTALISRPSTFNPKRSPIVIDPVGSMSREYIKVTMSNMVNRVNAILEEHAKEKGVIHTSNTLLAQALYDNVAAKHRKRLLIAEGAVNNERLLEMHRSSTKPTVLISPSMMAGVDLEDSLARFQIVVKFPFASLGDARVAKKMKRKTGGREWYKAKMLRSFVQECGRGTRSSDDWCVTYVLDGYVENLLRYDADKLDEQFKSRFVDYTKFDLAKWRKAMR